MFEIRRSKSERVILYVLLAIILIIVLFPVYWLFITSVKTDADTIAEPPIYFPTRPILDNYKNVISQEGALRYLINSLIISLSTVGIILVIGPMLSYSLSKYHIPFKIRTAILGFIIMIRIFPPVTTLVPYYLIIWRLKLIDTHLGLIIAYVAYVLPFATWLMLGFFQDLPQDIEKAAIVDGCTFWQRFRLVVLPLTLPGLATTAIFTFMYAWIEFMYASVLTSVNAKTLPVVIAQYSGDFYLQWGNMSAMGVLMVIPVLIFATFMQRYLVRGLTFGAVKE